MKVTFILLSYNFFVYAMDGFSRNYLGRYGMGFVDENQGFDVGEDYEINICNNNRHGPCYVVMGGRDVGMANSGLTNIEKNSWPWPWSYEHMIGLPVNQGTLKQRNLLSGIPATHRPPRPRNLLSLSHGGEWHMISAPRLTITSHGAPQKLILRAGMLKANGATVHCHAFQVVRLQKGRPAFSLSPIRERHMTN